MELLDCLDMTADPVILEKREMPACLVNPVCLDKASPVCPVSPASRELTDTMVYLVFLA